MGGGVGFILAYEAEGFTSVLEKRHIFKATGGAIMGGADGGAIFGIHGGAQEGRWIYIWSIFYLQKRDFLISMFVWAWKGGAPPWINFRNIKIWYVTINQNKKSLIFDYY